MFTNFFEDPGAKTGIDSKGHCIKNQINVARKKGLCFDAFRKFLFCIQEDI